MDQELNQLIDETFQFLWADSPVFATYMGIHSFDGEIDRQHRTFRRGGKEGGQPDFHRGEL